jgi:hypothetical protein
MKCLWAAVQNMSNTSARNQDACQPLNRSASAVRRLRGDMRILNPLCVA